MKTLKTELRELAWLASIVSGLSLFGVGLAVTFVMALVLQHSSVQDTAGSAAIDFGAPDRRRV